MAEKAARNLRRCFRRLWEPEKQLTRPAELDSVPCAVPLNPWFFGPVCRQLTERRTVDDTYARLSMRMGPDGNHSYEKKKIVDSACRSGMLLAGRGGRIRPKCTIQPDGYLPGRFRCLPAPVADQSARLTHGTDDHPTTAAAPGGGRRARTQPGRPGAADRWLISQLGSFSAPFAECFAVSRTNDPTGAYNLYAYSFGNNLNDYPKIGVWPTSTNSAYTATYNLFLNGGPFVGAALCAYDRAAMLAGAASPVSVCYTITNDGGYLPSDLDGSTLPPAGSSGLFLTFETLSTLRYYRLSPNFANPGSSTLSAPTDIAVASFSEACGGGTCIPQAGTSQLLDSLGDRPMYRLAYRNFGDHRSEEHTSELQSP